MNATGLIGWIDIPGARVPACARPVAGGIVQDADSSVRLAVPVDLRALLLRQGERHGFPRVPLTVRERAAVPAGRPAWETFAAAAPIAHVADVLLQIDDWPAEVERRERLACWRAGKRRGFPLVGRDGWASFAVTAPLGQVRETLSYLAGTALAAKAGAGPQEFPEKQGKNRERGP